MSLVISDWIRVQKFMNACCYAQGQLAARKLACNHDSPVRLAEPQARKQLLSTHFPISNTTLLSSQPSISSNPF